ncbi:uncharacterized protein ARMOST_20841 [Armillaria ostoyae]|uniref:Benzoate 4-monooxygenase cytochrome P450 n=1 Tax=Armillaria ostoyae TaxID=47428 RepID=A0A284S8G7_ARMOS|nr:uncharacterized protein ARMOST_20841 [Armillaria ostoyae]
MSGDEGEGWIGHDGLLWLDCLPWMNYLAFDIIGDLAFGAPFGMIKAGRDSALVPNDPLAVMASYSQAGAKYVTKEVPAMKILNREGGQDSDTLVGMAIVVVSKRLSKPSDRNDLLSKLQAGKDEQGNPMGWEELTVEALTLLIVGSDTTTNSSSAIIYFLAHTPRLQEKLHKELDKNLDWYSYGRAMLGLPRVVPEGGMMVLGKYFPPGTVVSVPSYTIHRDPMVWGDDVEEYRPERWFECDSAAILKMFNPFSVGPQACVGCNLVTLELHIIIASILKCFHFVLEKPDKPLQVKEGFLRKPLGCCVGLRRRETF